MPDHTQKPPTKQSWRDDLPVHPAAELFPLLSETDPAALNELGEDIKKNGLTLPIVLWSDGKSPAQLLDGRNRLDAIEIAIGRVIIGPPSLTAGKDFLASNKVITLDRSVDPYLYVVSANFHRRHLNAEEREKILFKLIARAPEKSDRQIAKEIGVDHKTIGRARAKGEDVGRIPHVAVRTDTKGRKQPAKKTAAKPPVSEDVLQQRAAAAERIRGLMGGSKTGDDIGPAAKIDTEALTAHEARAQAQQDVGENSRGEVERLRVCVEEQANENQRLRKENIGLQSELEELRGAYNQKLLKLPKPERVASLKQLLMDVDITAAELAADPLPHPLDIPPSLRRANPTIDDNSFRDYRKLPLADLENLILTIQRTAGGGAHFSQKQWRAVDGMRKRAAELRGTALTLVHNVEAVA